MPETIDPDPFLFFVRPLNQADLRFMVTGSVAAMLYGEPRLTNDIDLVLFLPENKIGEFEELFPLEEFYCPPEDVIRIEAGRPNDGHFNLIHHLTGFKADIYLSGNDPLHLWALEHSRNVPFEGENIPLAPPEYVIIRKAEYYKAGRSEKHVRDIRTILECSEDQIDTQILDEKIADQGLQAIWEQIRSSTD